MALNDPRTNRINQEDGFTLMELLVVMLIIGILSAIAVPAFLSQRRNSVDSDTKTTLGGLALKADQVAPRNENTQSLSMEAIKAMNPSPTALKVGTIVGVSGNATGGYCLTAYHPDGTYSADEPLILDSKLSRPFITNAADLGGGACAAEVWGNPIQPAYEIREVADKPTLVRMDTMTPRSNACHGVTPYSYGPEFQATTTSGEAVNLEGSIRLSNDCRELHYDLRVVQASKERQYQFNLSTMNGTPGGLSFGTATDVVITGTAETTGVIETGWKQASNWNQLVLGSNIRDGRHSRNIFWTSQP